MANPPGVGGGGDNLCKEKVTEWFWETGPDQRFTYFSNEGADATGLVSSDIIGKRRQDLAADRDDSKWVRHLADLEARRPFWGFEYSTRIADGALAHLSTSGEPRLDEDGRFLGYRGATSDITERKKTEQELREARDLFQAVLEHAPFGIALKDRDGRYLETSREWQRRFGMTRDEVVGKTPSEFLPAAIAKAYEARDSIVLKQGQKVVREESLERRDGRSEYFLTTRFPTLDCEGRVAGLGLISTDITERKLAEIALEANEQQLRAITDNLPFLISRHDRDTRYRFINREGASWYGLPAAQIIGKSIPELFGHEVCDVIRPYIETVLSGNSAIYSGGIAYPDGISREVEITFVPDRAADDTVQGWFALAQDTTERKRVERELADARELFDSLMQAAPFEIVFKDREGKYLQVNRAWEHNNGRTNEDVVGRRTREIFPAQFAEAFAERDRAVLEGGQIVEAEEPAAHIDGTTHDFLSIRFPLNPADRSATAGLGFISMDITARKQAERALREREGELGTIADNLPVLMARFDRDWRYRFINREGASWYGMPASEIVGKTIPDLFPRKTVEDIRPSIEAVLRGENARFVGTMEYPDGKTRNIEITFAPDSTPDGEVQGWFALAQDLTAREKADEALRKNERQLRTVTDNLPVLICRWDRESRFEFINRAGEKWYGRPIGEIVGKKVLEILGAESNAKVEPWMERALKGERVRFEERMHYPDGTFRDVDIAYIPDVSRDGEIRGCFGLVQNITERKAAESRLRESEEQLRTVADNLPAFITHVDRDQRYRFANRVAEEWYGRPASEIIGRQLSEIHVSTSLEKLRPRVEAVLAGQDVRFEDTILYPDKVARTVDQRWIADRDEKGHTRGWFSLIQDISERKRLEADLLRQERLAAMGQLTGTVAHELRNPLGAVAASIAAVRRLSGQAGLDLERSLARAERGIARSDRIITELLDFARAKGLQREPTRFSEWLSAVIADQDIPDGVSLSMDTVAGDVEVMIDREDYRRAIINVVDNACQAAIGKHGPGDSGEGRVEIACGMSGTRLVCEVRDNGPGIPADCLSQVMEPLYSTKSFGTGLGLPTVQRIMEEHGGGVEIESEPGKGALVRLWLPLDTDPPEGPAHDNP
jgi:PAS domain S-box-containing protein